MDAPSFARRSKGDVPVANDTSVGVGYAPASPLETETLALERRLNSKAFIASHPGHGEDMKIMAFRRGDAWTVTVARAFIASHVPSRQAYDAEKRELRARVADAVSAPERRVSVHVNAADAADGADVYLTVTGTSAESGDDGEVGRGNRCNGLITPLRPMSLEALAGKNPISHVGKLYNLTATPIARAVTEAVPAVFRCEVYLVSRIGAPIDEPALVHVRLGHADALSPRTARVVDDTVRAHLADLPLLWRRVLDGSVSVY